jgi:hypothetical protein
MVSIDPREITMNPITKLLEIWHDIDHAQKRMFELRTGVRIIEPRRRGR